MSKTSKLRRLASGRDCQIRVDGVCNGDSNTVVLCHLPGGGMGTKSDDLLAAYGCSNCHDSVDGRSKTPHSRETLMLWHLQGVIRTQQILIDEGVISVGK